MAENASKEPTKALLAGRRALEELDGVELIEDYIWNYEENRWVLHINLRPEIMPGGLIPAESEWYVTLEDSYPWGSIIFYPATKNGIKDTFQHQNYNGESKSGLPWRTGRLCLETDENSIGRSGLDTEPFTIDDRLKWHTLRALEWLKAASSETLALPGESFELPDFRSHRNDLIAFNETPETLRHWEDIPDTKGYANVAIVEEAKDTAVITCFHSRKGEEILKAAWNSALSESQNRILAGWVRLKEVPFLKPYRAPKTLGELYETCISQGINIKEVIISLASRFRDNQSHLLFIGCPIPKNIGDKSHQMHWMSIKLPVLSAGYARGFQSNEKGWQSRDKTFILRDSMKLEWIDTENWSPKELSGRGGLPDIVANKEIFVIGGGALGSVVCELLVRAGVYNTIICDSDDFEAGNLVRHTLTVTSIGKNKAKEIAKKLKVVSPHANPRVISTSFPPTDPNDIKLLQHTQIVIDCTGSDKVLNELNRFSWEEPKVFLSASIGLWAKRLFLFSVTTDAFPHETFIEMISPWLKREQEENTGRELPREGIGCWHPLFPARVDDIWVLAGITIKYLENVLSSGHHEVNLTVFEQSFDETGFTGFRKVNLD